LGTCSGIFTDETPDIPGGFTRPGFWAICFRDWFCICKKASVDGSFAKSVPRNEAIFLFLVGCELLDMAKERAVGDLGDDERCDTGKPGDRGLLSTSEGEVMMVEVVTAVFVVRAVPMVLVDCRDPAAEQSTDKELR
jgi:hypothetical protein